MNTSNIKTLLIITFVSLIVSVAVVKFFFAPKKAGSDFNNTTFEKIVSLKHVRCGYVIAPPHVIKNPTTGALSGIIPDILNASAANIGYKIDWAEEVGWGTMIEGLKSNRYDMVCTAVWPSGVRAQFAEFSEPLYYSGIGAYVRANDTRFDKSLDSLNSQSNTIVTSDGEISQIIAAQLFPKARTLSLSQLSDNSQLLLNVGTGKGDLTFTEAYTGTQYMAAHPGQIKNVSVNRPLRIYANTVLFHKSAYNLKGVFDAAFNELLNSGQVEVITNKYAPAAGAFYQRQNPYRPD